MYHRVISFQRNVVDFLLVHLGLDYNESEVLRVIGILRTNAFFVEDTRQNGKGGGSGRAVYPTFSFLSHSCACNARYRQDISFTFLSQYCITYL